MELIAPSAVKAQVRAARTVVVSAARDPVVVMTTKAVAIAATTESADPLVMPKARTARGLLVARIAAIEEMALRSQLLQQALPTRNRSD